MILTLMLQTGISTLALPEKIAGQFWLYREQDGKPVRILCVEGIDQRWVLKAGSRTELLDKNMQVCRAAELESSRMVPFRMRSDGERGMLFCEPASADRCAFRRYVISGDLSISIGRNPYNQICYRESFVSGVHAVLNYQNHTWQIEDRQSANGTFVNGKPVSSAVLSYGDMIYILGLKIVVGRDCLAVNDPGGRISMNIPGISEAEKIFYLPAAKDQDVPEDGEDERDYYSRSPRFKQEIEPPVIKIDAPPANQIGQELPWPMVIGSSVTMGAMSAVMLVSAIASQNVLSMVSGCAMLLGTLLLPLVTKSYERKQKRKREALRQEKYSAYLNEIRAKIQQEIAKQETILRNNFVTMEECENRILTVNRTLWDRDASQNDFLRLRLGVGNGTLDADIQYPERRFTLDDDNLSEELLKLGEEKKILHDIPITVSLQENYVAGVLGAPDVARAFVQGLIFQIAAFYSYDEVKMVFLYDSMHPVEDFVRWLPHVWNDERTVRFITESAEDNKELSAYFENVIESRDALDDEARKKVLPYYVIFDYSREYSETSEMMKKFYAAKKDLGISVVSIRSDFAELPKDCRTVIQLNSYDNAGIFDRKNISGEVQSVRPDIYLKHSPAELSKTLANVRLNISGAHSNLPKMLSFLEMYAVGKLEHLNPAMRWKENDPVKSLQVPVGVGADGNLFYLDLHEKFHGPHGLIAGMTGSGKSEFIITYILSLAVNFRPEEVAFVLIDYKGGGLAGAFEDAGRGIRLPHLVGTITNLDGAMVKRSLISIQSELRRRQAVFNEARRVSNEGTMDIYKYQRLYREHVVEEPVPHLFIISDEFAELKMQQPEFMEQLVSAARIGRSLGVHLILATQKPSGVVDDQIWSNSRFRVCLKVQDRADSMDMIKRPEAASLVETGRFYLQVGFNEYFDIGQSAWCGAPYYPSDKAVKNIDNSIRIVDQMGRVIREIKPAPPRSLAGREQKQVVAIVNYLSQLAKDEHIQSKNLWLDPIPEMILTDLLAEKYHYQTQKFVLNPVIGEYDDPYNQKQHLLTLPISADGNALVYGSTGSGKEQFLHAIIYSMLMCHGADELNLYLLDFGAETLYAYEKAPQVGGVLLSSDSERMINLFRMLREECAQRRKKFMMYGGSYAGYMEQSGKTLPNIVVVLNNYAAFIEMFDQLDEELALIAREGPKYGIYFVLTVSAVSTVRYRLQQSFKQMFALQMNDPSDYHGIFGPTDGVEPSKIYGRGIIKRDMVYEFQTAHTTVQPNLAAFNQQLSQKLAAEASCIARRIPVLPEIVDADFAAPYLNGLEQVPVGMENDKLVMRTLNIRERAQLAVLAETEERTIPFVRGLVKLLTQIPALEVNVIDPENLCESDLPGAGVIRENPKEYLAQLILEVADRYNTCKNSGEESMRDRTEKVFILAGFNSLCEKLDADGRDKLSLILDKSAAVHRLHYIICDSAAGWSSANMTIFRKRKNLSEAIWAGEGIADQYVIAMNRRPSEEMTNGDGYMIEKGRPVRVRLLTDEENQNEEESA